MKIIQDEQKNIYAVERSDEFESIREKLYSESITKIKLLSAEVLKEMKVAQEKLSEGDLDYVYDNYEGFTETHY